jgi:hypothetical protein
MGATACFINNYIYYILSSKSFKLDQEILRAEHGIEMNPEQPREVAVPTGPTEDGRSGKNPQRGEK